MKSGKNNRWKMKRSMPRGRRGKYSLSLILILGLILSFSYTFSLGCNTTVAHTSKTAFSATANSKAAGLKMDKPILVLRSGASNQLTCTLQDQPVQNLQWSSSDQSAARVDAKGVVTAFAKGTAVITAVTGDGKAAGKSTVIIDRDPLEPLSPIANARYQLQNGIYINSGAEKSHQAVLMLTGDLMCVIRQQRKAQTGATYNFNPSFDYVKNILGEADFAAGNLETMLSHTWPYKLEETKIDGQWNCNAPETFLDALRYAGFDGVVTANNHSCDTGPQGVRETLAHLNRYQFLNTGMSADQNEQHFFLVNINGIRVAFMSYTCQLNGAEMYFTEDEANTMINIYSPENVARDVAAAKAKGAEFIITYVHWGRQNAAEPTKKQLADAQDIADAGADYIIGSHPHVLQPYDVITADDGRLVPVIYSMGNFVASMDEVEGNRDAIILRIGLKRTGQGIVIDSEGYYPCYVLNKLNGFSTVVVPTSPKYNSGLSSEYLEPAHQRIVKALGVKITEIN